jgi:outer membrane lipase/esterase
MNFRWATAIAVMLGFATSSALASTYAQLDVFGDSTVDSGWWAGALQGQCGAVTAPCTTGNPTKDTKIQDAIAAGGTGAPVGVGLMNTQILASKLGLSANPANQPGGTNYAISGSLTAATAGAGNLNPNPNLPSTIQQIANYLAANGRCGKSQRLVSDQLWRE